MGYLIPFFGAYVLERVRVNDTHTLGHARRARHGVHRSRSGGIRFSSQLPSKQRVVRWSKVTPVLIKIDEVFCSARVAFVREEGTLWKLLEEAKFYQIQSLIDCVKVRRTPCHVSNEWLTSPTAVCCRISLACDMCGMRIGVRYVTQQRSFINLPYL